MNIDQQLISSLTDDYFRRYKQVGKRPVVLQSARLQIFDITQKRFEQEHMISAQKEMWIQNMFQAVKRNLDERIGK